MQPNKQPNIREIRTPQGNAKICELYNNGSNPQIIMKIRGNIYTFPSKYLIDELTDDISSESSD